MRTVSDDDRGLAAAATGLLANGAYRDSDLSMEFMARQLRTHSNHLSRVINGALHKHFPALVQRYRIQYFVSRAESGMSPSEVQVHVVKRDA